MTATPHMSFPEVLDHLHKGDFSILAPVFEPHAFRDRHQCRIVTWYENGFFDEEPTALAEALACACFLGQTDAAVFLLDKGVRPESVNRTGMNAFHWAANRGNLDVVRLLIKHNAPLEMKNQYGGTVLGTTLWSLVNEPKPDHMQIIEALLAAGAEVDPGYLLSGNERVDELLRLQGAGS